jgi:hypothetical protein
LAIAVEDSADPDRVQLFNSIDLAVPLKFVAKQRLSFREKNTPFA